MTLQEFSNNFDVLLNSSFIKTQFGVRESYVTPVLDEYEKSVLLTEAQDFVLKQYLFAQEGEDTSRIQIDVSTLITIAHPIKYSSSIPISKYDPNSISYMMPSDILFMLNEKIYDADGLPYVVIPLHYKEYDRLLSLPYSAPLKKQVWRLYHTTLLIALISELIPADDKDYSNYTIRYIKQPRPIILTNLSSEVNSSLTIGGQSSASTCELPESVHYEILRKAVELAYIRVGGAQEMLRQSAQDNKEEKEREPKE